MNLLAVVVVDDARSDEGQRVGRKNLVVLALLQQASTAAV